MLPLPERLPTTLSLEVARADTDVTEEPFESNLAFVLSPGLVVNDETLDMFEVEIDWVLPSVNFFVILLPLNDERVDKTVSLPKVDEAKDDRIATLPENEDRLSMEVSRLICSGDEETKFGLEGEPNEAWLVFASFREEFLLTWMNVGEDA